MLDQTSSLNAYRMEENYRSPFSTRYSSPQMQYNFSDVNKFTTWRKLWIYLAKAEQVYLFDKDLFPFFIVLFFEGISILVAPV